MKFSPIITGILLTTSGAISAASYEVEEVPLDDVANFHFGTSIDDTNTTISTVRSRFNPEIDLSLFNVDNHPTLPDNVDPNNFTTSELTIVANDLIGQTNLGTFFLQKLAGEVVYTSDGTDATYLNGFDQEIDATNGFTFSLNSEATDSTNGTHFTGAMAGPFQTVPFTTEDGDDLTYVINDFMLRGFVQVGQQVTPLVPEFSGAGGFSFASAINDNLQVAGVQSVASSENLDTLIGNCEDPETRGDQPLEACIFSLFNNNNFDVTFSTSTAFLYLNDGNSFNEFFESEPSSLMDIRPTMWQVDSNGQVVSTQVYDLLFTPEEFDVRTYARAMDINNNGTMVGFSTAPESQRDEQLVAIATVFENGETTRLFEVDDIVASYAMAINDDDIVVGFFPGIFNDRIRNRMFVYDRNTQELTRPNGFFVSSSTHPRSVNNNGLVVGDAESDIFDVNTRQTSGFLYNVADESFVDLNTLIPCDSPYTIIGANDINDGDVIIADAQIRRPNRDIRGEVVTGDDAGDNDFVVSVKLTPTGNPPSECETDNSDFERQGASFQVLWLLALFFTAVIRLRRRR
ncbi:MAG: DUF3466 family protein [Pseudomonadota bacterium]